MLRIEEAGTREAKTWLREADYIDILDLSPALRDKKLARMGKTIDDFKQWRAESEAAGYPEADPGVDPSYGEANDAPLDEVVPVSDIS